MKKIISLFQRDYAGDRLVRNELTPGAEWVVAGEGIATRKFDGTCCMIRGGRLFKRYEGKQGGKFPADFEAATEADPVTHKIQGWVPVGHGSEDQWHREAWETMSLRDIDGVSRPNAVPTYFKDATYELVGPKVQGNPERYQHHTLVKHGEYLLRDAPRDFEGLKSYLEASDFEGIVWHHPDGRMVKIKRRDFFKS